MAKGSLPTRADLIRVATSPLGFIILVVLAYLIILL